MPGPLPKLIRDLSVHEFFRTHATFPNNRGQDLNLAAKFLLMKHKDGFANLKKTDLDRFVLNNEATSPTTFGMVFEVASENLNRMNQVFFLKDPLLRPQAQLPVYYWLVKTRTDGECERLRAFLVEFEQARLEAREVSRARAAGETDEQPDLELMEYNAAVRTPDDRTKQQFMFEVLIRRFTVFLRS